MLEDAERQTEATGHELDGFLSASAGFMPKLPTVLAFPPSHAPWDEVVERMPELWRTVSLRSVLRELPVLGAGPDELPDEYVWRASCALSIFAHSYVRVEKLPAGELPISVSTPWAQVNERLKRPEPYMSYNDLIVYNHRLRDPSAEDPYTVENMELLVPTVDNVEERLFYLAQVEILARGTPLITSVVRAQEAVLRRDSAALEAELWLMLGIWRDIVELSFYKVDPNPLSLTYVDQVVWANTVAPLAVPIKEGTLGPAGAANPIFALMDAFFGRRFKEAWLAKEVAALTGAYPAHQLDFIRAVGQISTRDYIAGTGDRRLQTLFDTVFDAYAGRKGYLGIHRLKVYGFLELAFKIGRSVTIAHIEGAFQDRQWKTVDRILEETREERHRELPTPMHYARLVSREAASEEGGVKRLVLDASETGAVYRPGDRCGVLTMNRPEAVEATLQALEATGEESIPLNARWRRTIRHRPEHPVATTTLPLRSFLSYARLRPLSRQMAKALVAVSASRGLREVVETRLESQWELADALRQLSSDGYNVHRLIEAGLEQQEAIARIVPPEDFRMYSVASAPDMGSGRISNMLELTVAQLRYPADLGDGRVDLNERLGTASTYLNETADGEVIPVQLVRPSRFALPRDRSRPIVMFAGGVGIAPFRGFIADRSDRESGQNWLFFATRSAGQLYCEAELADAVARGNLAVRVAFTAEDGVLEAGFGEPITRREAPRARIDAAIARDPAIQEVLWELLRSRREGGKEAWFYVCGRAGFAQSVIGALRAVADRFLPPDQARLVVPQLVADGRFMLDVFTSWTPHAAPGVLGGGFYDASEVALHTTPERGQWLTVNGTVYDMTEFLALHPGGPRIIVENLGMDATREYEAVLHHENSEIDATLAMYKIGSIRRLNFGDEWGMALVPGRGLTSVSLHDVYRAWVRFMHLLTEMSNALSNDWDYMGRATTRGEDPDKITALKAQFASNTHQRFLVNYYRAALGEDVLILWALTRGLCAPSDFARSLRSAIADAEATAEAATIGRFSESMKTLYQQVWGDPAAVQESNWRRVREICALVQRQDTAFLTEIREIIRSGVMVFEELEARTAADGGERLIATLDRVPELVRSWHRDFLARLTELGALPAPNEAVLELD